MKTRNHTIVSVEAEKAFDNVQHALMIKTLTNMGMGGKSLHIIKAAYGKPTAPQRTPWRKAEIRSSENRNKTRRPTPTTLIQHRTGSLSQSNQARKRNRRDPSRKGRRETLTLCGGRDSLSVENPEESTPKRLEIIHKYGKCAGYTSTYKDLLHLDTPIMNQWKAK